MSAIPTPPPLETQEHIAPPVLAPAGPPPRRKWWVFVAAVIVAIAAFVYAALRTPAQPANAPAAVRTAKVTIGPFQRVLRVTGTTAARNFATVTAPMMRGPDAGRSLVLMELVPAGSIVKKGDLIADIDAQPIKDHVDDLDVLVKQAEGDVIKRKAEQAIEMETLRQNLRAAKAAVDKAKLDNQAAEIRMPIDKELLAIGIQESEAQYKELQQEIVTTEARQRSEIKILEYTMERHARHRDRHRRDITRFLVHAPIGGLVVMQTIWRGGDMGQVQQGDQISPGQPFLKIVDTSSMQVEASVNQAQIEEVHIGQRARINFDAFPGQHFEGRVLSVGAMGVGGWRENYYIRTLPLMISIRSSDTRVIPDLSASADVILDSKDNAVVAPLEAVSVESGKDFVYVKQGGEFVPRQVRIGERNNTQAVILAGLKDGDEVALSRPEAGKS